MNRPERRILNCLRCGKEILGAWELSCTCGMCMAFWQHDGYTEMQYQYSPESKWIDFPVGTLLIASSKEIL